MKKVIILILVITSLFNALYNIPCYAKTYSLNAGIITGSRRGTVYSRDVPIDIYISYTYEEKEDEDSHSNKRRVISIDNCTATCRNLDYYGTLSTSYSYTDTMVYVSVFGTLNNKDNSTKTFYANETFIFSI